MNRRRKRRMNLMKRRMGEGVLLISCLEQEP